MPPEVHHSATGKSETGKWDMWSGKTEDLSWEKHGYTGKPSMPSYSEWFGNREASWVYTGSFFVMTKNGWNAQEKQAYTYSAGVPIAFAGQVATYYDAWGRGGEYHYVNTEYGQGLDTIGPDHIYIASDPIALKESEIEYSSNPNNIQKKGGHLKWNGIPPSWKLPTDPSPDDSDYSASQKNRDGRTELIESARNAGLVDDAGNWTAAGRAACSTRFKPSDPRAYAFKLEWWNPTSQTWTAAQATPGFSIPVNGRGKFSVIYRFPRQLSPADPFYNKTNQWAIEKTRYAYPYETNKPGGGRTINFGVIGRPLDPEGKTVQIADENNL